MSNLTFIMEVALPQKEKQIAHSPVSELRHQNRDTTQVFSMFSPSVSLCRTSQRHGPFSVASLWNANAIQVLGKQGHL